MTETYAMVGSIRKSLTAITDHWAASLNGPRRAGNTGGSPGTKEPPAPVPLHTLDVHFPERVGELNPVRHSCECDVAGYVAIPFPVARSGFLRVIERPPADNAAVEDECDPAN